jgi:hypothetical protein
MRVRRGVVVASVAGALMLTGPAQAGTPEPLIASAVQEWEPAAADGILAWAQTSAEHPRHFDVVVRSGDEVHRVNPRRSAAAHPSIDLANPHLGDVVALSLGRNVNGDRRWDLAFFDLQTGVRLPGPPGLNTDRAERLPSISGDHLLFARRDDDGRFNDAVLLYDLSENSITKLDAARNGVANAGAVNGDWATWQKCGPSACMVFRHQLSTGVTTRLRTAAPILWSPTIASDGTVFLVRSGHDCGQHSKILRVPVHGGTTTVAAFAPGVDASDLYVHEHDGAVDLYLSRVTCEDFDFDVYRITGV